MIRVVADSNVFVSALRFGGSAEVFLAAAEKGVFVLVVSEAILAEVADVLARKFAWTADQVERGLLRMRSCEIVRVAQKVLACIDPDDDRILEAAVAGAVDYLVSGDRHLLRMEEFRGVKIITLRTFLDLLSMQEVR